MTERGQNIYFEEETIDLKGYFFKIIRFWYFFPFTILVSLVTALLIIGKATPTYKVGAKLLIKDEQSLMDPSVILQNAVSPFSVADYKIRNEIEILNSYNLTKNTVQQLNLSVSYFIKDRLRFVELYKFAPFTIKYDSTSFQPVGVDIFIKALSNGKINIWASGEEVAFYQTKDNLMKTIKLDLEFNDTIGYNEKIRNNLLNFEVVKDGDLEIDQVYKFRFRTLASIISEFKELDVQNIKSSSVIRLEYIGPNVQKSKDYLNKFIQVYLNRGVEKKNQVAVNTIEFINSQIDDIADSLKSAESRLERYRTSQSMMNIDFQSQQVYQSLEKLQNQKAELILRQKYYTYLQDYLTKNQNIQELIAPSSMGIEDPLLNNLIMGLTKLYTEKVDVMINTKKETPYLESVRAKIENQKNTLLENVINSIDRAKISLKDINERIDKLTTEVQALPETQRRLFTYEREFQLQDALYTFLLRKKSELQIAKASNFPENEVIDYPRLIQPNPVYPNKRVILLVAFILGVGVPVILILSYDYLSDKVMDVTDVERITDKPILGNIIHHKVKEKLIVQSDPKSLIAESFRSLRANFHYILGDIKSPVVMVTSTIMGEGKSFVSTNLAASFANYNKKVLLLSFDLRRPTASKILGENLNLGLSNYLSGNCDLEEIISQTEIPNLWLMPTGPIPPNPSELIGSDRTEKIFQHLRSRFDFIIVDTPPIGVVSDALLLEKFVDRTIFIVRHNYSKKRMVSHLFSNLEKKNVKNINVVVNDIDVKKVGYGYYYSYDYNYN